MNWFRRYQLIVGTQGQGISIDNFGTKPALRIKFEIIKSLQKEPNSATIDIFNLSPATTNSMQNEYTDVTLNAGYDGAVKLLYAGSIQFASHFTDKTEVITELVCGDGDKHFRNGFVNKTFAKGTTDEQIVDYCITQLPGLTKGPMQLNASGTLRGRSFSKMAHELLDEIARTNGCNWSIQDGQLHMVRADAMLNPNQAIVLTATTGLLEAAERTDKGISAKCQLDPRIAINTAIKLDNASIRTKQTQKARNLAKATSTQPVALNKDGIYKVFKLKHSGDTRDTDWSTEVLCVGLGQPIPTTGGNKSAAVPVGGVEDEE